MVVFDRLLARLLETAPNRWVVKGGIALDLRLGGRARTTKDLDLARRDDEERATDDLLAAAATDLGDFFRFSVERTAALDPVGEGAAVRYRVRADLDGRKFEEIILDIGFGDPLPPIPDRLVGSGILEFAGIARIEVPALPLEQHLAEKLHAYTRAYGGGQPSSRVKDLVDLVLIRSCASFLADRVETEIRRTFTNRSTHELPSVLPQPPQDWASPYRSIAQAVGLDPRLDEGFRLASECLDPILADLVSGEDEWDPGRGSWSGPPGEHTGE